MNRQQIEERAWAVQREIWRHRKSLWPSKALSPHEMLCPAIAAKVFGVRYEEAEELGRFGNAGDRFEVAGLINRSESKIAVSNRFKRPTRRFTGAHEVGHWDLHPNQNNLHRDRPVDGIKSDGQRRPDEEKEADYYAACLLVPRRLLAKDFSVRFGELRDFRFGDNEAFWVMPGNPRRLLSSSGESLEWQTSLATAIKYGSSEHFISLTELFQVSPSTMAIRLHEIGLRHL